MLLEAAAETPALRAVVSEGAGNRSYREVRDIAGAESISYLPMALAVDCLLRAHAAARPGRPGREDPAAHPADPRAQLAEGHRAQPQRRDYDEVGGANVQRWRSRTPVTRGATRPPRRSTSAGWCGSSTPRCRRPAGDTRVRPRVNPRGRQRLHAGPLPGRVLVPDHREDRGQRDHRPRDDRRGQGVIEDQARRDGRGRPGEHRGDHRDHAGDGPESLPGIAGHSLHVEHLRGWDLEHVIGDLRRVLEVVAADQCDPARVLRVLDRGLPASSRR